MTNYNFCEKNDLPIFLSDINDVYERIINYPEIGEMFLKEKLSFDWGEHFGTNELSL